MKKTRSERKFLHWLPAIMWAGLIFYLSSLPDISLPGREFLFKDKIAHAIAYGVLSAFVFYGCGTMENVDTGRSVGLIGVIIYGFMDEIHQKFVPGRLCDQYDFLADSIGAFTCFALFYLMTRMRKRKTHEVQVTERNSRHSA